MNAIVKMVMVAGNVTVVLSVITIIQGVILVLVIQLGLLMPFVITKLENATAKKVMQEDDVIIVKMVILDFRTAQNVIAMKKVL